CRVAGQTQRSGRAPPSRDLLRAVRCAPVAAATSAARAVDRERETQGIETVVPDSFDRSDSRGAVNRDSADAVPLPRQETTVGLRWPGHRNAQQRRSSVCERATATIEETSLAARAQPQSQSRTEKH